MSIETGTNETTALQKRLKIAEYIATGCISLTIFSAAAAYFYYDKAKKAEDRLGAVEMEKSVMSEVSNTRFLNNQKQSEDYSSFISCLHKKSTTSLNLSSANSHAIVWWNKDSKEIFLTTKDLPASTNGKPYHLWVSSKNKTMDAGEINLMQDIQKMNNVEEAEEFFIADESKGKLLTQEK